MQIDFVKLLEVQSESYKEERMNKYLVKILKGMKDVTYHLDKTVTGTNIYVTKNSNKSTMFPCIVAHTDTVHKIVSNLTCIEIDGAYTGFNKITMTQSGIGGDDKVGIFVALRMLNELDACKVAFFHAEEVGCVGSRKADLDFFKDCRFVLQCDRKGNSDFVTDIYGTELSSKEWQKDIESILTKHNYKFSDGGITDVGELKDNGLTIPVANMSCGYYNPHMSNEFIVIEDVENVISMVKEICQNVTGTYYHKAEKKSYGKYNFGNYYDDFDYYDYGKSKPKKTTNIVKFKDGEQVGDWIYIEALKNWYHTTDVWEDAYGFKNVGAWAQSLEDMGYVNPYEYLTEDFGQSAVHINCPVCMDFLNPEGECPTCKEMEEKGIDTSFLKNDE